MARFNLASTRCLRRLQTTLGTESFSNAPVSNETNGEKMMTFPLFVGALVVGAVIVAVARQHLAARNNNSRIELGVKQPSKPR